MKRYLGAVVMLAALATPATATQLNVSVTGVLTSQTNAGTDPNLSVGSTFTLAASFDDSYLKPWTHGNPGDQIVGLYALPDSSFRIDAPGLFWDTSDAIYGPWFIIGDHYDHPQAYPAVIINGDKVVSIVGDLSSGDTSLKPQLGSIGANFAITPPDHTVRDRYVPTTNDYQTPGFMGVWDFANATVTDPPPADAISAVPEPTTWAMFLLGFGTIGWSLRRRSLRPALHV